MFLWPDGSMTGSVDWVELQGIVSRRDNDAVTEAGWAALDSLLAERAGAPTPETSEDEAPEPTKAEIQDQLRELGLPTTGNKAELQERLAEYAAASDDDTPDEEPA